MVVFVSGACALTESRPVRAVYARDLPPCFFRVCLLSLRVHPSGPFTSFRRFARVSASHALSRAPLWRFASPSPPSLQSYRRPTVRSSVAAPATILSRVALARCPSLAKYATFRFRVPRRFTSSYV